MKLGARAEQNTRGTEQECCAMKTLTSAMLGTTALALIALGAATPAQARSDVGVYVGPFGVGVGVDAYRDNCRDRWYRHNNWNYCHRYYDYDDYYTYPSFYYRDNDDWRRHHRDRDRDNWG